MVGSNTIHCARADTVTPTVTSASAMNFFMVCLSLCCRCRRQHAANHEKGFTTNRRRCGVSRAQRAAKSWEGNLNGRDGARQTPHTRLPQVAQNAWHVQCISPHYLVAYTQFVNFACGIWKRLF